MTRFALYGWLGLAVMLISQSGMLLKIEPFWSWHTPISWTGFILVADAVIYARRGDSWLMNARAEFVFLTAMSLPLWLVFEWYNWFFLHNWHYVNLPENTALRYSGYTWSFCTIWPAIFEAAELAAVLSGRRIPPPPAHQGIHTTRALEVAMMLLGAAFLIWPIAWPSPYLAAPVWLGFILLLDPINARAGDESIAGDWRGGRTARLVNLTLSGFLCGVLWEFWNYWARARWIYTVPILPEVKIFEMPILGFFGFPAFAIECFTMYVLVRRLLWHGRARTVAL